MAEYRSNSNKIVNGEIEPKEQEKRIEPAVSVSGTVRKRTGLGKFAESLIATSASDLGSWILADVIIPKVKDTIYAVITGGANMLLYGKTDSIRTGGTTSKISYGSFYSSSKPVETLKAGTTSPAFDYDNIVFPNRGEAEAALSMMRDILDQCESVSVSDFYDIADVPAPSYTATKYGWTNLQTAQVFRCNDGYIIKLPRAKQIG